MSEIRVQRTKHTLFFHFSWVKNNVKLVVELMFTPIQAPSKEIPSASIIKIGSMKVVAKTRVATRYLKGLAPLTSIASICSVTFIEPISAPMLLDIFPAKINAAITGPISRIIAMSP